MAKIKEIQFYVYDPNKVKGDPKVIIISLARYLWTGELMGALLTYRDYYLSRDLFEAALELTRIRIMEAYLVTDTQKKGHTREFISDYPVSDYPELLELFQR